MVGQGTSSLLFRAMSDVEFRRKMAAQFAALLRALKEAYFKFRKGPVTPESTHTFECRIETIVREFARSFMQWNLGSLESETTAAMPPTIFYGDDSYRRLPDKTWHSNILTRFGDITLERTVYRRDSRVKVRRQGHRVPLANSLTHDRVEYIHHAPSYFGRCVITLKTFITSSPRWLITFTAMRPDDGLSKGRLVSLWRDCQASSLISALSVVLSDL